MQPAQSKSLKPFNWIELSIEKKMSTTGDPLMYLRIREAAC